VQVASAARLRKLRQSKGQTELSGADYEAALRRQHCALHPRTTWAMSAKQQQRQGKAGSAAADDAVIDEFEEPDEETAERLLMSGSGLLLGGAAAGGRGGLLAPGALELSRLRDANGASPSDAVVQALQFHPNGQLMLTAGFDKRLKLFQVSSIRKRVGWIAIACATAGACLA
jgi:U3 small nucleolar RNA-associated protein 18